MIRRIVHNRKTLFWTLHIAGWMIYLVVVILVFHDLKSTPLITIFRYVFKYSAGFFICLFLRKCYKKSYREYRSIPTLVFTNIPIIILAMHIWYEAKVIIEVLLHGRNYIISTGLSNHYFGHLLHMSIPLITWSILYFGIKFWLDMRKQREKTEKANSIAQAAQLKMLRYQINPHFLFNSLNSIRALIDENDNNAKAMVTDLSEFLRYSLLSKNFTDVPFNNELEAIRLYFAIEKRRYEDKLEVDFDIDPRAEDYPVLSFLMHPIAENAIKYGMQTSTMPLKILIKAEVSNGILKILVSNTGKWVQSNSENAGKNNGTGTGLYNVRKRLENAFPGKHRINILENEGSVNVQLEIENNGS